MKRNFNYTNILINIFRKNGLDTILNVQLEAVKLLEMAFLLPTSKLPQFQMYKWAFITSQVKGNTPIAYQPHVQRIHKKMELTFGVLLVSLTFIVSKS